jgi:predicted NAD/FAD-dependent oxidoreductase
MNNKTKRARPAAPRKSSQTTSPAKAPLHFAVVGAGMAGVACARTLVQAGHRVTVFEKSRGFGGRMATRRTEFGGFDHGAQYFTVRDHRFARALLTAQNVVRPWSVSTVRVLDEFGHVLASAPPPTEPHFVATPGMSALVSHWMQPLAHPELHGNPTARTLTETRVTHLERDALHPEQWQLRAEDSEGGQHVIGGFDRIVLAIPHLQAHDLLLASGHTPELRRELTEVQVAPCWALMVAARRPCNRPAPPDRSGRRAQHAPPHLARENSNRPRAHQTWTIQASPAWSSNTWKTTPSASAAAQRLL